MQVPCHPERCMAPDWLTVKSQKGRNAAQSAKGKALRVGPGTSSPAHSG